MGKIALLGLLLLLAGFVLIFAGTSFDSAKIKSAGGLFIGPIPVFGFASDRKMLYALFAIGILLFVISYFISRNF